MPILYTERLSKSFPGVNVLQDINFEINEGEVHALLGENGAGKSTLIKILTGVHQPDSGKIYLDGKEIQFRDPQDAFDHGITVIHQELNLLPDLDVATNIFVGNMPKVKFFGIPTPFVNKRQVEREAKKYLDAVDLAVAPNANIRDLSISKSQLVEIAKAISREARIIFMDEPTSSLTPTEQDCLFNIIREMRSRGIAIVYISHKLDEIKQICDRISILRDGVMIRTELVSDISIDEMIEGMVGRDLSDRFPKSPTQPGAVRLEIKNLNEGDTLKDISFCVRAGEVVGLSGLVGAGRTELARAIFGADRITGGEILIDGKPVQIRSVQDAIDNGIAFLTEDRKNQGLLLGMTIDYNLSISSLNCRRMRKRFFCGPFIRKKEVAKNTQEFVKRTNIKTPSIQQLVKNLSGGNQQKVILAKWLSTDANIFIFDEPTRGIDVGAKAEIYSLMDQLFKNGAAIIMISAELPEVIAISDRILVMHEGKIVKEVAAHEATEELLVKYASMGA